VLICHKFFLRTTENRLADPSEICALDFKGEFRRFRIALVSATIGIDWSIPELLLSARRGSGLHQKYRQPTLNYDTLTSRCETDTFQTS
jgi:hypothetical protein